LVLRASACREGDHYRMGTSAALICHSREGSIKAMRLLSSRPSRGHPFPAVFVMEAAENRTSHDLAVLGEKMPVTALQC
jgi:hypothetical protein